MKRFAAKVTVVEHNDRTLNRDDEDVAGFLEEILEREGVRFITNASISSVSGKRGDKVTLRGRLGDGSLYIEASHILCATGRTPNTDAIGADAAGLKLTQAGHVEVDEWNRATENRVFAVGDCGCSPHFTHIAFDDFRIIRDYPAGKADLKSARRSSRQVPFTLFTDSEFAHVGLREHEAKSKRIQYRSSKLPMAAFLKTRTLDATEGFAKVLVAKDSDEILGFSAIGKHPWVQPTCETSSVMFDIMRHRLTYTHRWSRLRRRRTSTCRATRYEKKSAIHGFGESSDHPSDLE